LKRPSKSSKTAATSGKKLGAKRSSTRAPKPRAAKSISKPSDKKKPRGISRTDNSGSLPKKKPPVGVSALPSSLALYVYGVTEIPEKPFSVTSEAVDGLGVVEPIAEAGYLCWASRVSRQEFALELQQNMQNLEWLAACSIRHQKVLSEIGEVTQVLPARFGTVFLSPDSLLADFREKLPNLETVFRRIADADEWGIKIFGTAQSRTIAAVSASSGIDYLKQKSAALQSSSAARRDEEAEAFGEELAGLSEASVPGGKASSGQPGLLWSASFLVKRSQKKRFDQLLKKYAERWSGSRRIDVSGPWPPYSFVNEG
jgi:hypothetical protein